MIYDTHIQEKFANFRKSNVHSIVCAAINRINFNPQKQWNNFVEVETACLGSAIIQIIASNLTSMRQVSEKMTCFVVQSLTWQ